MRDYDNLEIYEAFSIVINTLRSYNKRFIVYLLKSFYNNTFNRWI